ncbi:MULTISPECIES: hypothetical protein [unclassified Neomoorella]|uniref:hypothetical protein n=1 Tax=unclassified Neomoorella TaxID=2676739 RepID=UPI001144007F|nr:MULTISPECIES: hypothetical protein [unclassified Moorella (in: firmicutes)]
MIWTIIGTVSSIISAIAAIVAAYFAFVSRPRKVKGVAVGIESVKKLPHNFEWEIEFSVGNLDDNTVLNDAMVVINMEGLNPLRIIPQSHGGLLMMPNMVLEANSVNFSIEKLKPRTKIAGAVKIKAEPALYNLPWYGYGANLKEMKGSVVLDLINSR